MMKSKVLVVALAALSVIGPAWAAQPVRNVVTSVHAQDLVALQGKKLVPFKSEPFYEAPYTLLYFGAGWCPDCRQFSPALVAAYNDQPAGAKRFEVLLVSRDNNAAGMLDFMSSEKMPWPAIAFDKLAAAQDLERFYPGHGTPCLTVIDPQGSIVLQSKDDQDAKEILRQLQKLVGNPSATQAPGKT